MKPYQANLFNATLLVILGLWSYSASGRDTHTLIVPALGILLSFFHKPFKAENKTVAHVVVVLTFLILIVLFLPLRNSINAGNNMSILEVLLMPEKIDCLETCKLNQVFKSQHISKVIQIYNR